LDGSFNESVIQSYAVFQVDPGRSETCNVGTLQHAADLNHVDLKYAVTVIPKRETQATAPDGMSAACNCQNDVYSVQLSWKLPENFSEIRLMISPVTVAGDVLPIGLTTSIIEDHIQNTAVSTTVGSTGEASTKIEGSLSMQVSNASEFVANPKVKSAIAKGIADTVNVPAPWVAVELTASTLLGNGDRRLQGVGTVLVNYVITIPSSAAGQNTGSASSVLSSLQNAQPAALTSAVTAALDESVGAGAFNVVVTAISPPTVRAPGTTTTISPRSGGTRAVPNEEEEETSNAGAVAGIVIAVLVGCLCCCAVAALVGKIVHDRRQAAVQVYEINEVRGNEVSELRGAAAGHDAPPDVLEDL